MSDLYRRLEDDRLMRDTARQLVENTVRNLRGDVEQQGIGARMAVRLREGAQGVGGDLAAFTRENPARVGSALALGTALLLGWVFRDRLAQVVEQAWSASPPGLKPDPTAEPNRGAPHSLND
jgi:hypothetical protein